MSTYIIGDVQGCYFALQRLLETINFNPEIDNLQFIGDLVNRGSESLATLRFIKNLKNKTVILGNHDLHLLTVGYGLISMNSTDTFDDIIHAKDKIALLDWLRHYPLIHFDKNKNYLLVHAGIPPQWNIDDAIHYAKEVNDILKGPKYLEFLKVMHGNNPDTWNKTLKGYDRLRYIVNAFTRLRFCEENGRLDFSNKTEQSANKNLKPWFEWRKTHEKPDIIFGHWASLKGKCKKSHYYAIDTGCVWGGSLTALRIEDKQLFSVGCKKKSTI